MTGPARPAASPAGFADLGAGTPTKGDNAAMKAAASRRDQARQDAYWGGHRGDAAPSDPELADLHRQGADDSRQGGSAGGPSPAGPKSGRSGGSSRPGPVQRAGSSLGSAVGSDDLAGLFMGFLGYVVVINYLRGGAPAVKAWFGAKFLNHKNAVALQPVGGGQAPPMTGKTGSTTLVPQ